MGLQKITFDGGNVSAKIDADLHHFLLSHQTGVLKYLKNSVSFTLANNTITFQDGYVAVYGRIIYVEPNTQIAVSPDSSKFGYVVLTVNTTSNTVALSLKEQAGSYPALSQSPIVNADGIYEIALCAYQKSTTSVTLDASFTRQEIKSDLDRLYDYNSQRLSDYEPRVLVPTLVLPGTYRVPVGGSGELMRSLIVAIINGTTHVICATPMMFITIGSASGVRYQIASTNYTLHLTYANQLLTLQCGNTAHVVSRVIIYKF